MIKIITIIITGLHNICMWEVEQKHQFKREKMDA